MRLLRIAAFVVLVTITGCSSDEDNSSSISETVLSGKVQGVSFTAKGGKAFDSGDKISVNITNTEADCQSNIFDFNYEVSVSISKKTGTYENQNVVFYKKGGVPLNQLGSTVVVDGLSDTSITVRIKAGSGENIVEGKFTVPYCK